MKVNHMVDYCRGTFAAGHGLKRVGNQKRTTTMLKPRALWIATLGIAFSMTLAARTQLESTAPAPAQEADDTLETVLVSGDQPGPGLWKVSRDDHVMWILGTVRPLPKDMRWRSERVEALIAGSQELLYPARVNVTVDIGLLRGLTLLPALIKAGKNPNDAKLRDVLPADTYAKWLVLKKKHMGDNDRVEKMRPTFAAADLLVAATRKSELTYSTDVRAVVNDAARKHKVRIHRLPEVTRKFPVKNARGVLKTASKTDLGDGECFNRSMDLLEARIEAMKLRANAWAKGDLEALRNAGSGVRNDDCMAALMNSLAAGTLATDAGTQREIDNMNRQAELAETQAEQDWLGAAQAALATNQTTVAVLPIENLLRPDGYAARLRERGYAVEEP